MVRRFRVPRQTVAGRRRGPRAAPRRKRPAGFSLVELLVAVLVMGVGVLGVTGLQMLGMQTNRSALFGMQAAQLADDMLDRVRANSGGSGGAASYGGLALGDPPPAPRDCGARDCTGEQMAVFDQAVWKCRLGEFAESSVCVELADRAGMGVFGEAVGTPGLPSGDGAVEVDLTSGLVRVSVQWRDGGRIRSIALQSRI